MGRKKDTEALEKYKMYLEGYSLEQVAKKFNCTRTSVFGLFKARDYKLRSPKRLEYIVFNGKKYTKRKDGYFRKTDGNRNLLHHDVWIYYNGEIPIQYDIHHKDNNRNNNNIENLEMILKSKHGKIHSLEGHRKRWGYCDGQAL
jgi:hypothetical protein